VFTVQEQIGLRPAAGPGPAGVASSTARVAVDDGNALPWYSPRNPMLWLTGVLVVTFGLGGVAGSVRLGKAKVSAQVGK